MRAVLKAIGLPLHFDINPSTTIHAVAHICEEDILSICIDEQRT